VSATALSGVAGAVPYLALAETSWPPRLSGPAGGELLFLALGSTVAGMLLWNRAIVRGGSTRISRLLYLEPVVSVLGAMVFLGERVTAAVLAGGVLVIAGVLITGDSADTSREVRRGTDRGGPRPRSSPPRSACARTSGSRRPMLGR
jgi:drug/metabolite transporter (DMT)-like permease